MHGTANTMHAVIHAGDYYIVELILYRQSQPELRQRGVDLRTPQNIPTCATTLKDYT